MSAIASIKIASALDNVVKTTSATVGVNRTLDPEGFQLPGVARWVDRSGGIAIGFPALTLSVRAPTKASRVYKVTAKFSIPTLEQTSPSTATGIQPQPTKAYDCTGIMEFLLPERSTLAERTAFFSNIASLFATTITASDADPSDATGSPLSAAILNFDPPY